MNAVYLSFVDSFIKIIKERFLDKMGDRLFTGFGGFYSYLLERFREWFLRMVYHGWVALLKFIYLLEQVFDIFTGVTGVYRMDGGKYVATTGNTDILQEQSFLDVLFTDNSILNAYWYMMLGAFALCFIVTVFAVIRSMGDSVWENRRPVTAVLRQAFKACVTFFLIPFACFMIVKLSSVMTYTVIETAQGNTRVCDALYSMGVGDNFKSEGARQYYSRGQKFATSAAIDNVYYKEINYFIDYVIAIFMIVIMMGCVVQSVLRAFALMVLFMVSPWFVAAIPFDDGEKFKRWKNMFTGYALASFGPMLSMRVYLAIVPALVLKNSSIVFWPMNNQYSVETVAFFWNWTGEGFTGAVKDLYHACIGFVLKTMILLGGAFAAWRSQYLMMEIMDPSVAMLMRRGDFMSRLGRRAQKGIKVATAAATGGASAAAGAAAAGGDENGKEE